VTGPDETPADAAATAAYPIPSEVLAALAMRSDLVVHRRDVPQLLVYQWTREGEHLNAWPGDGRPVPPDAARVLLRLFNFPTGALRELVFAKGALTPAHVNKSDIILYNITGRQVQISDDDVADAHVGDAAFHPAGVMHYSLSLAETLRAEFAFAPRNMSGDRAVFLPRGATADREVAKWLDNGEVVTAYDADAAQAPADARFIAKIFAFPGYRMVEARYPAGARLSPHLNPRERILYLLSGRMRIQTGAVIDEVETGDIFRAIVGETYARAVIEDAVVLEVDASRAPL
jgi:quercetin dioxygenase-like cupin family protein